MSHFVPLEGLQAGEHPVLGVLVEGVMGGPVLLLDLEQGKARPLEQDEKIEQPRPAAPEPSKREYALITLITGQLGRRRYDNLDGAVIDYVQRRDRANLGIVAVVDGEPQVLTDAEQEHKRRREIMLGEPAQREE